MRTPEDFWPIDEEYAGLYRQSVHEGSAVAKETSAAIVAIARNSMPHLENTLALVSELSGRFRECVGYVYENGSEDSTPAVLDRFAASNPWVTVEHGPEAGVDSRGFERERTERLAACRNRCHDWVSEHAAKTAWTIVLDTDPHGGFSVDGVMNSLSWLGRKTQAAGMASYGVMRHEHGRGPQRLLHYDAWAARPNWWRDRREEIGFEWFFLFLPPAGSPPVEMNSAFGGLAVYRTEAYLAGRYSGEDCEHVPFHRSMRRAGWQMYLNPGSRYVAFL